MSEVKHQTIFHEPLVYAGWPANHGAWQWGNELVFGFLAGPYDKDARGHAVVKDELHPYFARSLDGGRTWTTERCAHKFNVPEGELPELEGISLSKPDLAFRFCGRYDHGQICDRKGGFYVSLDRCKTWKGPYRLNGPWDTDPALACTTRTRYLLDRNLFFFSAGLDGFWGNDRTYVAKFVNGRFEATKFTPTGHFELIKYIDSDMVARSVMPAVAELDGDLFCITRRKGGGRNWLEVFVGAADGVEWESGGEVVDTGQWNGNPPSLVNAGGNLYCAVGLRSQGGMALAASSDGLHWDHSMFRVNGGYHDFGYPQIFFNDNRLVIVYYWVDDESPYNRIECTEIEL